MNAGCDLLFSTCHPERSKCGRQVGAKDRLSNGIPIETVSAMLGHKNFRTTQIYAKVVQEKISEDMKKLREKLF